MASIGTYHVDNKNFEVIQWDGSEETIEYITNKLGYSPQLEEINPNQQVTVGTEGAGIYWLRPNETYVIIQDGAYFCMPKSMFQILFKEGEAMPDYTDADARAIFYEELAKITLTDINGVLPITQGGTGAMTVASAQETLGLAEAINNATGEIDASRITGILDIEHGGTGASLAPNAFANLGGKEIGKLSVINLSADYMTGILPVDLGGTGVYSEDIVTASETVSAGATLSDYSWKVSINNIPGVLQLDKGGLGANLYDIIPEEDFIDDTPDFMKISTIMLFLWVFSGSLYFYYMLPYLMVGSTHPIHMTSYLKDDNEDEEPFYKQIQNIWEDFASPSSDIYTLPQSMGFTGFTNLQDLKDALDALPPKETTPENA